MMMARISILMIYEPLQFCVAKVKRVICMWQSRPLVLFCESNDYRYFAENDDQKEKDWVVKIRKEFARRI